MPDVVLRPRDASRGTFDSQAYKQAPQELIVRVRPRDAGRGTYDVQLYPHTLTRVVDVGGGPGLPTFFDGFKVRATSGTVTLALVDVADAQTGMGGVMRVDKNGTVYALYFVETTDPDASPVRVQTTTGIKSIRLKT